MFCLENKLNQIDFPNMLLKKSRTKTRVRYGVLIPLFFLASYVILGIIFNRRGTHNGANTTALEKQGILPHQRDVNVFRINTVPSTASAIPEIDEIREKYLVAPASNNLPNLKNREAWKGEITAYVHSLLEGKRNGFFIEAGANDGEFYSNTLALELLSGWTGLLVEPIPTPYKLLVAKKRKAWITSCCLSPEPKATMFKLVSHRSWGALANIPEFFTGHGSLSDYTNKYDVQCYPLHYLLMAIGQTEVDYLSLDIEGAELAVLKTIPFDKISIKVITVEINNGKEADVTQFMTEKGYKKMRYIKNAVAHDNVYMKVQNANTSLSNGNELPSEPDLDAIRATYLTPAGWAFTEPRHGSWSKQVQRSSVVTFVQNLLKNKVYGFFIEAGANDGGLNSHTLSLEVLDGWTGLLVQPNPQLRNILLTKKRNVWVAGCCLSTQTNASKVQMVSQQSDESRTTTEHYPYTSGKKELGSVDTPCVPLHHLLNAIGQIDVDFLKLDVGGGAEFSILKTIPFEKINITVISVEISDVSKDSAEIREYLINYGYKTMGVITDHGKPSDAIFMKSE